MNDGSRIVSALLLSGVAACSSGTPVPDRVDLNGSFERSTPRGHPTAWYVEADPATAEVSIDGTHVRTGQSALHVRTHGGPPAVLYTPLATVPCLKGADARATVYTRSSELSVALFFLTPGASPQMGTSGEPLNGGWQEISVSRAAERECLSGELLVGIFVTGEGEAWIDDVRVTVSPPTMAFTDDAPRPHTAEEIAEIRVHAVPVRAAGQGLSGDERKDVRRLFETARIAGLGENSHGARALFHLKHDLVRLLVEELHFDLFALEMPAERAELVDDYVQGRSGDADAALLALSYPAWQSEELWAVIEWLRGYNQRAEKRVAFYGLDVPGDGADSDDERMAERATSIMDHAGDGARMIVWADNTHVTRAGRAMGALLSQRFPGAYIAVGLTFDEGYYSAYGPEKRYAVHEGYPGTHEHLLSEAGPDAFLLELSALSAGHALNDVRGFRYIGSQPQTFHQFYPHRLGEHFDIVGFVRTTDSIRYLLDHAF